MFDNNISIDDFFNIPQFSINKIEKEKFLIPILKEVHSHHVLHCEEYKKISESIFPHSHRLQTLSDLLQSIVLVCNGIRNYLFFHTSQRQDVYNP